MYQQSDGLVVSSDFSNGERGVLFKYSFAGELIWKESYEQYMTHMAACVVNQADEIFATGYDNEKNYIVLLKISPTGEVLWEKIYQPELPIDGYRPKGMTLTEDEGVAIAGNVYTINSSGIAGVFVLRLNSEGELGDIINAISTTLPKFDFSVSPNPTTDKIIIRNEANEWEDYKVTLYDSKGVAHYQIQLQGQQSTIDIEHLPSGVYILALRTANNQILHKTVVKE